MKKNKSKFNVKNVSKAYIYNLFSDDEPEKFEKIKYNKEKRQKFKNNED